MKIRCPHCDAALAVRDDLRGKTGRCPRCRKPLRLEPTDSAAASAPHKVIDPFERAAAGLMDEEASAPASDDTSADQFEHSESGLGKNDSSSDEFGDGASLGLFSRPSRKKRTESVLAKSTVYEDNDDEKPKRRRWRRRSTRGMLASVIDRSFWRSALGQFPYLAAALATIGALLGFLVGLVHSAMVAGLVLNLIGIPTAFIVFFMMSYPTSCFWKVLRGSAESYGDLSEWPQGNYGEYVFEMLFVGYLVLISLLLSGGVGKLRESLFASQLPSEAYWQLIGSEREVNTVNPPAVPGAGPVSTEAEQLRPMLQPGPGWTTTFIAFVVIFPLVVVSCVDPITPVFIPWSLRVWPSLVKKFPAWLVVWLISGGLLGAAAAIIILGATHAPFLTFTLCSPLAAFGLLLYGRVLGQLSWLISQP
jgi:hypothetical protein